MKLLKCHIENFGKLHEFDHTFDSSFDKIIENNGWGKTTLSAFIKAMFYGLPTTTRQNLDENEKKKYNPWQGGNFGGYIDFEIADGTYRIQRFFGRKEADDTFDLIDLKTGKPSAKYSKDIGVQLFDLDADAYERSTFIPQKQIVREKSDSINSKLINMMQGTSSPESFEKAKKILDDKATELKKKKGSSGKIDDVKAEIEQVSEQIDYYNSQSLSIDVLSQKMSAEEAAIIALEAQKQQVSERIADYSRVQKILANKKYIDENQEKKALLEGRISSYQKVLNGNVISTEDLRDYSRQNSQLIENKTKLQTLADNDTYTQKFDELNNYFNGNCPTEEDVDGNIKLCRQAQELSAQVENLKNEQRSAQVVVQQEKPKKKPVVLLVPLILAIIAVVVGCVIISQLMQVAIILFVVAFVCLAISGFMYLKNYIELKTGNQVVVPVKTVSDNEIKALEDKIAGINGEVDSFICRYSKEQIADKVSFLYDLQSKIKQYKELEKQIQLSKNHIDSLNTQIAQLANSISSFLGKFAFDCILQNNQEKLDYLKAICENLAKDGAALKDIEGKLDQFKSQHPLESVDDSVAEQDIVALQKRERELQNDINEHREEKNNFAHKIDNIRNNLSALDELEARYDELKAKKEELEKQHKTLKTALEFLTKANDNLSSKYLKPMKDGINKYLRLVLKEDYENDMNIDTDFNVSYEKYGKSRAIDFLSKGYQEVVDISIRFALVDTLFSKEKPFIILDDPFVNMDKPKIQNALNLLNELSKEYQLIYLSCHPSRC